MSRHGSEGADRMRFAPREGLALFFASLLLLVGAGPILFRSFGVAGQALSQLLFVAAPTLVAAAARAGNRHRVSRLLGLRRPHVLCLAGAAMVGMSLWALLLYTVVPALRCLVSEPEVLAELAERIAPAAMPTWQLVAVIALVPALCEELLFRGVLLNALAGWLGARRAVVLSAVLFALFHIHPVRMVPSGVFGLALAWTTVTAGSIYPAIVMHALHNAMLILFDRDLVWLAEAMAAHPSGFLLAAVGLCSGGAVLVGRGRAQSGIQINA